MTDLQLSTIRALAADPLDREAEVIQFLVEVRKLIRMMPRRYPVLGFYTDWVLHHEMSWHSAKQVLKIFDDYVQVVVADRNGKAADAATKRLSPLISLQRFRDDLALLLYEHKIKSLIIDDIRQLVSFLSVYTDIIARTPLVFKDSLPTLIHINNIHISKVNKVVDTGPRMKGNFAFAIKWALRKGEVEMISVVNEVWIPVIPLNHTQTLVHAENIGGKLVRIPLESRSFID